MTQPHDLIRIIHDTLGDEVKVEVMSEDDGQLLVLRRADAIAFLHAAPHGTEYARRLTQTHRWGTATWQFTLDHDQWPDEPSRHALGRATSAADRYVPIPVSRRPRPQVSRGVDRPRAP